MTAKRVANSLPKEAMQDNERIRDMAHMHVIREHLIGNGGERWPGPQKNVYFWIEVEGGKAIGWNENPASGWTFPIIKYQSNPKQAASGQKDGE